ncbi:MAG: DUF799 family lipoprotein [Bacteroidaceae bacterium]|nr:DUF799 family lipoprotein [Bacteroidaceae bacterium]
MKRYITIIVAAIVLAACGTQRTLVEQYPKMYEEKPLSIAIMPPINQTTHADAKDYFYTTLYAPLCEKGYYVFSPYLTMEMFQNESAYDSEMFLEGDLSTFNQVLGADALMFTIVKGWSKSALGGSVTAHVEFILRSAKTGETIYQREGKVSVSTSSGQSGLLGLALTALNTALTDKIEAGRRCTAYVLSNMPAGKYHPMHDKDQESPAGDAYVKGSAK